MSNRNDYDYFDMDNFDDSYDSRDYRRRQQSRRQGSYNRRPAYNSYSSDRKRRKRKNSRRTRNRVIIVASAIAIIALFILILTSMFKGCNSSSNTDKVSTDTITKQAASAETTVPAPTEAVNNDLSTSYFKTPEIKDDKSDGELVYNIYIWNKAGFELFYTDSNKPQTYADTINGFADKLGDIKVYDMIIPNHTEYGLPQRLKSDSAPSDSQADMIKETYSKLSDKVTAVNAYNYLADHNSEYIYFNSDHHWTGLGSYYAYKAFADTNKLTPLSLDKCTEKTIEGFTGTFTNTAYGLDTDTVHYWELPYEVTMEITSADGTTNTYDGPYYSGAAAGEYTYGVFLVGDNPLTVLKSGSEDAKAGKKIAVVKESYGNALAPYLTNNYEEVHVIDFRTFRDVKSTDLVSYCKENSIDEVLFLNGVMSANTQIQLDSMSGLFN